MSCSSASSSIVLEIFFFEIEHEDEGRNEIGGPKHRLNRAPYFLVSLWRGRDTTKHIHQTNITKLIMNGRNNRATTGSVAALITTSLQRGERRREGIENRFNGFSHGVETVETVSRRASSKTTSLKRGVIERPLRQVQTPRDIYGGASSKKAFRDATRPCKRARIEGGPR